MSTSIFNPNAISLNEVIDILYNKENPKILFEASNNHSPESPGYTFEIETFEDLEMVIKGISSNDFYDIELTDITK